MRRLFLVVLVVLSLAVAASAQTFRGTINGTVTDPSGAVVAGATVKATEVATNIDHTTITTTDGKFAFQDVPLGFYKIAVSATGFPTLVVDRVEVIAGSTYTLGVQLKLEQNVTTVEISAAAITMDTSSSTQAMDITDDAVQNLPLNGRDFTQMIAVQPGFGGYNVGGFGSLNGTRPNQINWQIDGVDNNDFWHNIPAVNQGGVSGIAGVVMPIDSIVEFSSQTQSGPEGGRNAGGVVNIVTRSGTNDWHGSLYYYNRNEYYAAHTPFLPTGLKAPPLRNENYGASGGGPILKDKLFIFANYEKQDYIIAVSGVATEPSVAWVNEAGNVLANNGIAHISLGSCNALAALTKGLPSSMIPSGCTQGNNGFWPTSGTGSVTGLTATTSNFFAPVPSVGHSFNGVSRLDYNITGRHHLYLRAYLGQGNQIAPLGASPALGTASSNLSYYFESAPIHVGNYSAVLNSTLTSRVTNQLLFGANYFNQVFSDANNGFVAADLGLNLSPSAVINGKPIRGAPNLQILGGSGSANFEQTGITPPEGRSDLTWHITDIVSQTFGKHQFRYGVEVRDAHLNEFYHRRGTGTFVFDGLQGPWAGSATCVSNPTLCSLADFLAGDVSSSTIAVGDPERWVAVKAFNAYFQDNWQVAKRLNLELGMRYEYFGPMHTTKSTAQIANYVVGTGFEIQGQNGASLYDPGKNHFGPRVGFAYQLNSRGDLIVRGNFGVYFDQINLNPFLDFRPPEVGAPQGIEGNPFGNSPISTYTTPLCGTLAGGGFQWDNVQQAVCPAGYTNAGAANAAKSIFPAAVPCSDPNCLAPGDPKGLGIYSVGKDFRVPYFYNYSLQLEKSFGNLGVWQIGYVGSEGRKLNIVSNINQNGAFPQFGPVLQLNTVGTSNYNALQTIFRSRGWHGLSYQAAYTWSHALDQVTEYRAVVLDDAFNKRADYGNGDYDTRNLFTVNLTYDVPKAKWANSGWSKRIWNGWQASSIMNFHSGQPYDEILSGINQIGSPFAGVSHSFDHSIPGVQWLNPAAFCDPSDPGCGGAPVSRNKYAGPDFKDVDLSVIKNIGITERVKLQLRADMFNLTNRKNYSQGVGAVGVSCAENKVLHHCTTASGFGQVSDTAGDFAGAPGLGPGEPFNMQLAVRLTF